MKLWHLQPPIKRAERRSHTAIVFASTGCSLGGRGAGGSGPKTADESDSKWVQTFSGCSLWLLTCWNIRQISAGGGSSGSTAFLLFSKVGKGYTLCITTFLIIKWFRFYSNPRMSRL